MSRTALRQEVRERLASVIEQAQTAQRMSLTNDNLTDLLDEIDNEVQKVIKLVERARGVTS